MTEPIEFEFRVDCSPTRAFEIWTLDTTMWWPPDHTVSAAHGVVVTFEPRVGGRIFERTPEGAEHDWGEILAWDPPRGLSYLWHLAFDRSDATQVEITFSPDDEVDGCRVRIEHRGWERLGAVAAERRRRNEMGWAGLLEHYRAVCH